MALKGILVDMPGSGASAGEKFLTLFFCLSLILGCMATECDAQMRRSTADIGPTMPCSALDGITLGGVQVTSAVEIAATTSVPAYCKVNATKTGTQLDIEVRLPEDWQQRFVQEGGAGFDGFIMPLGKKDIPLSLHAVQALTNGGHRDPTGNDLLNDAGKIQMYAYTAIGVGTQFAKAVTLKYYGRGPSYSYFEGCSNGGRGALNAADKYGTEFDAVIAGAPTRNMPGQVEQWTRASELTLPSRAKLVAIHDAAVAKCDALDGVADGIISNWEACRFDPTVDVPKSVGLTSTEAAAVKALMTDLQLADGTTIYSGYLFGSMAQWGPAYASLGVGHRRTSYSVIPIGTQRASLLTSLTKRSPEWSMGRMASALRCLASPSF
jgi:feruloyl esterase